MSSLLMMCPYKAKAIAAFIPSTWTLLNLGTTNRIYNMKVLADEIFLFPTGWTTNKALYRSTDGKNWTKITTAVAGEFTDIWKIGATYYANALLSNSGGQRKLVKSTDLVNWSYTTDASGQQDFIAYTDRFSVVASSNGLYAYQSTNLGTSWQAATIQQAGISAQTYGSRVLYGPNNTLLYPADQYAGVWKTVNGGQAWTYNAAAALDSYSGAAYDGFWNGKRMLMGRGGIYSCEDPLTTNTWVARKASVAINILHGSGDVALAAQMGTTAAWKTSDAGLTWSAHTLPNGFDMIRYFKGVWVGSRSDGKIMYAED